MKRSDAITVIKNILDVIPDDYSNRDRACAILNKLEEFMCPAYQIEQGTGYPDELGQEIIETTWVNGWAVEDE